MKVGIDTIIHIENCKEAFGSLSILDNTEFQDVGPLLEFAQVICNYNKLMEIKQEEI